MTRVARQRDITTMCARSVTASAAQCIILALLSCSPCVYSLTPPVSCAPLHAAAIEACLPQRCCSLCTWCCQDGAEALTNRNPADETADGGTTKYFYFDAPLEAAGLPIWFTVQSWTGQCDLFVSTSVTTPSRTTPHTWVVDFVGPQFVRDCTGVESA